MRTERILRVEGQPGQIGGTVGMDDHNDIQGLKAVEFGKRGAEVVREAEAWHDKTAT